MKTVYFIFIISLFLFSCNKKEKQSNNNIHHCLSINLEDKNKITESPALTNISFIKLETNDECLLENITKVVKFKDKLFILSTPGKGNIMVFNNNGNFLYKFKKGNGPKDLIYPTDISINKNKETICIIDAYRSIKEYNLEGDFLNKTIINEAFFNIEAIGNDYLLFDPNSNQKSDYYVRYHSNNNKKIDLFPKNIKTNFFSLPNFFTRIDDNNIAVSCIFSDTIYQIDNINKTLNPYLILNFNGKSANKENRIKEIRRLSEYINTAKAHNYCTGPCDFTIMNDNIFFTLKGKNNYFVTYNKLSQNYTLHKNLINGLPNTYVSVGRTNNEVIFSIDMPRLFNYLEENKSNKNELTQKIEKICTDENDNPILIFGSI